MHFTHNTRVIIFYTELQLLEAPYTKTQQL
jgi:hypothetical protein